MKTRQPRIVVECETSDNESVLRVNPSEQQKLKVSVGDVLHDLETILSK